MEPGFRLAVGSHIVLTPGWAGVAGNALIWASKLIRNTFIEVSVQNLQVRCAAREKSPINPIF